MGIKIILEIGIALLGMCLLFLVGICILSTTIKSRKIKKIIFPFIRWFKTQNISFGDLTQTIISFLALLLALYALTMDSIRDNDSSKRYSESVKRDSSQHLEIINVYQKQTELIEKYSTSADSMLKVLKKQAKTADMQYENQILLTQPGVNLNYQIQDTKKTSLSYENKNWIMPKVIIEMYNYGSRTAEKVSLTVQIISPDAKCIQHFDKVENLHVLPEATLNEFYFPVIALEDKNFFLMVVDITWKDKINNKLFKEKLYNKFIREKNDFYTFGKAEQVYIQLIDQIISNPSKIIRSNPVIRKYMYDTYNK